MSQSWPYQEVSRIRPRGDVTVFETGYGPSGLPHLGTFAEVCRTAMVQRAYEELTGNPTNLIVFSDDTDALRRVPDNIPNRDDMRPYLGYSLSRVPDPFGTHESFAQHNNAQLCDFLDRFGFSYEFRSARDFYTGGAFDDTLLMILRNYDRVRDIILPTLGEERRATYSPFMPILPDGRVLDHGYVGHDADAGTVTFRDGDELVTVPVTGGSCKLQWKVDWAMRWMAFGVDYEMAGKDLIDSVQLSGRIVRALGYQPPAGFNYEMFLDADGHKISKSLGNGLSLDDWLRYGTPESLSYFLFREPRKAKSLHAGLIPRAVEDYWESVRRYPEQTPEQQRGNPVHFIDRSEPMRVSYTMLLNLVSIMGEVDEGVIWDYLCANYVGDPGDEVRRMIPLVLAYYRDHRAGQLVRREATPDERVALNALADRLAAVEVGLPADQLQAIVYQTGKDYGYADRLRDWFAVVYEVVFGSSDGPRLGGFIEVYGVEAFVELLRR